MTAIPLLDTIASPKDLKALPISSLDPLAQEIRQKIIHVLSQTGGHLASNLGIIELTLALHYVFSSPEDHFIFDVGHQAYTHKLLTGRNHSAFQALRHDHGFSGFTNPDESEHDLFFSGHAGTALSLALGIAKASTSQSHCISILGDASFSCGLTLEALNNVPKDLSKFIVVLNDNNMSISENVGTISKMISSWIHHPRQARLRRKLLSLSIQFPKHGRNLLKFAYKFAPHHESFNFLQSFFEKFGFFYIGPVDGHQFDELIPILKNIQHLPYPVLVHVCTIKGKGLEVAQENPTHYHGVPVSFSSSSQSQKTPYLPEKIPTPTFPKIFGQTLCSIGRKTTNLHVVIPAMSLGSCVDDFKQQFPQRCIDVGIAEGHAVTFSAGIARTGAPVICSIYSTFLQRAFDNIFHDICMQSLPVIFAIDRAGLSHGDGRSHHGIYDLSFLRTMPQLIICQPRNAPLLQQLLISALSWNVPIAIRYPNLPIPQDSFGDFSSIKEIGQAEILSQGEDLLILALGHMCSTAMEVKTQLLSYGITATVVDPIFVKPLDQDLFSVLLLHHSKIVIIEEHSVIGGLGSAIKEFVATYHFSIDLLHFAVPDIFLDHGERLTLLQKIDLLPTNIVKRILVHFHSLAPSPLTPAFDMI